MWRRACPPVGGGAAEAHRTSRAGGSRGSRRGAAHRHAPASTSPRRRTAHRPVHRTSRRSGSRRRFRSRRRLVPPHPRRHPPGARPGARPDVQVQPVAPAPFVVLVLVAVVATLSGSGTVATTFGSGPSGPSRLHLLAGSPLPSRALYGWGGNDSGQVGIGSVGGGGATGVTVPAQVSVPSGTTMASVAAGGSFSVGLTTIGFGRGVGERPVRRAG